MVITDRFVYLHIPKSGGTFVEEALSRLLTNGPSLYIDTANPPHRGNYGNPDQHERHCHVPLQYRNRPLLASVRNPYDHHVSLYEFGWWKSHPGDTFDPRRIVQAYPHFPELSFTEYLEAANDWDLSEPSYAPASGFGPLKAAGIGPLTFDFIRYLAPDPDAVYDALGQSGALLDASWLPPASFLPTHRLNHALYEFLLGQGYEPARLEFILGMAKVFPGGSKRSAAMAWPSYYDERSKALVRHRERFLFELFPEFDDARQAWQ